METCQFLVSSSHAASHHSQFCAWLYTPVGVSSPELTAVSHCRLSQAPDLGHSTCFCFFLWSPWPSWCTLAGPLGGPPVLAEPPGALCGHLTQPRDSDQNRPQEGRFSAPVSAGHRSLLGVAGRGSQGLPPSAGALSVLGQAGPGCWTSRLPLNGYYHR